MTALPAPDRLQQQLLFFRQHAVPDWVLFQPAKAGRTVEPQRKKANNTDATARDAVKRGRKGIMAVPLIVA
jgi:hypothetical protein